MNKRTKLNGSIFAVMTTIPLIGELITATPDNVPGTGFSILLYQPFDFAYSLLTLAIFLILNIKISSTNNSSLWGGAITSIGVFILWFIVSFLLVGQLHISLGGKL